MSSSPPCQEVTGHWYEEVYVPLELPSPPKKNKNRRFYTEDVCLDEMMEKEDDHRHRGVRSSCSSIASLGTVDGFTPLLSDFVGKEKRRRDVRRMKQGDSPWNVPIPSATSDINLETLQLVTIDKSAYVTSSKLALVDSVLRDIATRIPVPEPPPPVSEEEEEEPTPDSIEDEVSDNSFQHVAMKDPIAMIPRSRMLLVNVPYKEHPDASVDSFASALRTLAAQRKKLQDTPKYDSSHLSTTSEILSTSTTTIASQEEVAESCGHCDSREVRQAQHLAQLSAWRRTTMNLVQQHLAELRDIN